MCNPEVPPGTPSPKISTCSEEVPLAGGERMPGFMAVPERSAAPGVLIVTDIYGLSPFYENLARRLARAGFVAYSPEYFFRLPPLAERTLEQARARRERLEETSTLEDLDQAVDWLAARPEVGGNPVGVVGFCMGGTFALNLAARNPKLGAAVCYYGFPTGGRDVGGPPRPLDQVRDMQAPLLGFWGDQDERVGMENVESLRQALKTAGKEHEFYVYPGLDHGFLAAFLEDPSAPGHAVACESWDRALRFFRQRLNPVPSG